MSPLAPARRLLPLLWLGTAACALARPEQVYLDRVAAPGALPRQLDATMRQFARDGFSGAVLVAKGSRVLLYQGYGDANRARHLPNTAETKFPFGALTNQFTAAALLQLETEGRLRLDQPAARWIGPEAGDATLAELLTRMREGSDPAVPTLAVNYRAPVTPAVERFLSPGPSYALLQRVLSVATGRPPEAVLHERLFLAAGMDRTVVDDGFRDDSLVARGYLDPDGATVVVTGLVGPLADLYHWHQALHLGSLLPAAARQQMFTPAANGYGLGWVVGRTAGGATAIEHASDQPGFQLWYGYFPDSDVLVLLAANNNQGFRGRVAERLIAILVDGVDGPAAGVTKADRVGGQ